MIRVRYAHTSEVAISGAAPELQLLRAALIDLADGGDTERAFHLATDYNPAPYDMALQQIIFVKADQRISIAVSSERRLLLIRGNAACMDALATYFDVPEDASHGYHIHCEYYDDHPIIAPGSLPLVIDVSCS